MKKVFLNPNQLTLLLNWLSSEDIILSEEKVKEYLENEEEFQTPEIVSTAESFDEADDEWVSSSSGSKEEIGAIEKMLEFAKLNENQEEKEGMLLRTLDVAESSDYRPAMIYCLKQLAEIIKVKEPDENAADDDGRVEE